MNVIRTDLPDVLILEPRVFEDSRGAVWESYNRRAFASATGVDVEFMQDNHSRSRRNVLRGLHYQAGRAQGKLVRVVRGEIFDVAVDLRRSSPAFRRWVGFTLSDRGPGMAWIPPGFAHGFYALTDAEVIYKLTDYYAPELERVLLWSDPGIGVQWPCEAPSLSERDRSGAPFAEADAYP
ncbi:MAG TPA: dTDP-4-dehydrorhamnose 3,5-epimerase [Burkholderiales bacterium]|nr:dTDP-4-dehydrorhamnose 3,5-epimerase [Burkholderiales bacterium]